MRILTENFPDSLGHHREALKCCLVAMNEALPYEEAILFGSYARGEARADSDVDLCIISDAENQQLQASRRLSKALLRVWPRPAFTLVPITSSRLEEKKRAGDHFFSTLLREGICIATKD